MRRFDRLGCLGVFVAFQIETPASTTGGGTGGSGIPAPSAAAFGLLLPAGLRRPQTRLCS